MIIQQDQLSLLVQPASLHTKRSLTITSLPGINPSLNDRIICFNREIGLTRDSDRQELMLALAPDSKKVYRIKKGKKTVGYLTDQGQMRFILEPVDSRQVAYCEDLEPPRLPLPQDIRIAVPTISPYLSASNLSSPLSPGVKCQLPSATEPSIPLSPLDSEQKPFYTLTGDLDTGMVFFVQRFQNSRKQVFLGEGQVTCKKTKWGKKAVLYEARLPSPPQHDDLLIMGSLFALVSHICPEDDN